MATLSLGDVIDKPQPDFNNLLKVLTGIGAAEYVPFYELAVGAGMMGKLLGKTVDSPGTVTEFFFRAGYDYVPVWSEFPLTIGNLADGTRNYPIKDWKSFREFPWPACSDIGYRGFETYRSLLPDGMRIVAQVWGPFETVQSLFGYAGLCYMLFDDPVLVEAVFDRVMDLYVAMYRGMSSIPGVGAVVISDDLGFRTQTLISVSDLRKYVFPIHKKLAEIIHRAGMPCIYHSCGQLRAVMGDIIGNVRIDAKHSYEDSILAVEDAIELYGGRVAILGGVDVDRLCRSKEDELRVYIRGLLAKAQGKACYAIGSGNSIPDYMDPHNYLVMLDEGWKARGV
jgi:uroporphyrinogen decarboxylase